MKIYRYTYSLNGVIFNAMGSSCFELFKG